MGVCFLDWLFTCKSYSFAYRHIRLFVYLLAYLLVSVLTCFVVCSYLTEEKFVYFNRLAICLRSSGSYIKQSISEPQKGIEPVTY